MNSEQIEKKRQGEIRLISEMISHAVEGMKNKKAGKKTDA